MLKIASWNVNSLNVRLPHVLAWSKAAQPDVLALQETKLTDDRFPESELREAGYHSVFSGQKTYNGVAILSRQGASDTVTDIPDLDDPQRRILAATIGGVRIVNLYVVNGSEVLSADMRDLRDLWEATSFRLELEQANPDCVASERDGLRHRTAPPYALSFIPQETPPAIMDRSSKIPVAILREEGSNGDRGTPHRQIGVLFLTDGSGGVEAIDDRTAYAERRHVEAAEALEILGVTDIEFLDLPDAELRFDHGRGPGKTDHVGGYILSA